MKVVPLLVFTAAVAAAPTGAYLGQVVQSFPSPDNNPNALAISPTCLYVLCERPSYIFRLNPANGSVISSYASPFPRPGIRIRRVFMDRDLCHNEQPDSEVPRGYGQYLFIVSGDTTRYVRRPRVRG